LADPLSLTGSKDAAILKQTSKAEVTELFMKYIHPSSTSRKKLSVHLDSQYQGVKFDPQRAMPMIQAFLMKDIPVSQQKFFALMASQPGLPEIQGFARECLAEATTLSQTDRVDLETMVTALGGMVSGEGEDGGAKVRDTNKVITDIRVFKSSLELSSLPRTLE
jgi:insulysin